MDPLGPHRRPTSRSTNGGSTSYKSATNDKRVIRRARNSRQAGDDRSSTVGGESPAAVFDRWISARYSTCAEQPSGGCRSLIHRWGRVIRGRLRRVDLGALFDVRGTAVGRVPIAHPPLGAIRPRPSSTGGSWWADAPPPRTASCPRAQGTSLAPLASRRSPRRRYPPRGRRGRSGRPRWCCGSARARAPRTGGPPDPGGRGRPSIGLCSAGMLSCSVSRLCSSSRISRTRPRIQTWGR